MRNLDIVDTRGKLGVYAKSGLLSLGGNAALAQLSDESGKI
jgi:argininosuccinate synthase